MDGERLDDLGTSAPSDKGTGSDGVTDVGHLDGMLQSFDAELQTDQGSIQDMSAELPDAKPDAQASDSAAALDAQLNDAETIDAQLIDAAAIDAQAIDAQTIGMDAEVMDAEQADVHLSDMALDLGPQPRCDDELQNGNELGVDCGGDCAACPPEFVEVIPPVYQRALRNPMKGFTTNGVALHEWATLAHVYIRWNELENVEADGIERIRQVTEQKFAGVAARNVKVIPRVYLHWSRDDQKYWPADMQTDDYSSEQFQNRLIRLVGRLGEVWNNDPRVAFIELGIFGKWGEHHTPSPEPAMQALAGRLFADAFPDKHVSVRHAWNEFEGHGFGEYWDSLSHYDQMWTHGQQVREMNQADARFRTTYVGGETAYDWGGWEIQPGTDPTDSVRDPIHRHFVSNTIRWLHCTQLRWIHAYDASDPVAQAGAEELQRTMGYRFILERVRFTPTIRDGQLFVELTVRNEGSAPFYYNWPLQVSLLNPETREPVWSAQFGDVDIRTWLGGEGWPEPDWVPRPNHWAQFAAPDHWAEGPLSYETPAPAHLAQDSFRVNLPDGQYILALAILDPASQAPSLRFATTWYFNGGYHPVGLIAMGEGQGGPLSIERAYDDPHADQSLNY